MSEPTSIGHMAFWGGGAIGSGIAIAAAAVEANPEMALAVTPDLGASLVGLVCAGVVFALKTYVPSEKDVKNEFSVVKAQHLLLLEEGKELRKAFHEHQLQLAGWIGNVDRNLQNINSKIDDLERRKAS